MVYIKAKTIVTKNKTADWFGYRYTMNIYRGCHHGCIYCDSRSECYHIQHFDQVAIKENALAIIRDELKKKKETGVIGTGSMSDPYNHYEKELALSRGALKLFNQYGFGIGITTKSDLVTRDIDLLSQIKKQSPVIVAITITAYEDELSKKIEPGAPVSSRRFSAIKTLSDAGIYVGILMTPILPFITDQKENITYIIEKAHEYGARFIYPYLGVTLRDQQKAYYYRALDKYFPGMKERYINLYQNKMACLVPDEQSLMQLIKAKCKAYNMAYRMLDIINAYQGSYEKKQLSLFD